MVGGFAATVLARPAAVLCGWRSAFSNCFSNCSCIRTPPIAMRKGNGGEGGEGEGEGEGYGEGYGV